VAEQDHSYKLLFGHPRMVRDFLEGFVRGKWVEQLDFSTLERVSDHYVSDDLRTRADDIVWRVRYGEHAVYLLFEFQSEVERFMAVRVLTYVGLLHEDMIREQGHRAIDQLPAILPIVLHSGATRWRAAEDLASLLREMPPGLERYAPQLRYLLIDENQLDAEALSLERNFAAMLFRLERCTDRAILRELIDVLGEWLQDEAQTGLRRAFAVWLRRVVLARLADNETSISHNLLETSNMLAERVKIWEQELEQLGLEKGLQKGREQGRREGEALLLIRQLTERFHELPDSVHARLQAASTEQLEYWALRVLSATSLQDIFGSH